MIRRSEANADVHDFYNNVLARIPDLTTMFTSCDDANLFCIRSTSTTHNSVFPLVSRLAEYAIDEYLRAQTLTFHVHVIWLSIARTTT